jgi:type III pantothenate kinase
VEPVTVRPVEQQVLAIDIGNTRVKAGVVDPAGRTCPVIKAFPTVDLESELLPAIAELTGRCSGEVPVVIAGVVDLAAEAAERILNGNGFRVARFTAAARLPLVVRYVDPLSLGIDRIANALFATTMFPDRPVILISAGTALVIDYVSGGVFHGGAILPGIRLQLESLHRGTAALPLTTDLRDAGIPVLPASTTQDCMTGGVVWGAAAAVEKFIEIYSGECSDDLLPEVIATGGDWELLVPCISGPVIRYVPDATLIGIARSLPYLN